MEVCTRKYNFLGTKQITKLTKILFPEFQTLAQLGVLVLRPRDGGIFYSLLFSVDARFTAS